MRRPFTFVHTADLHLGMAFSGLAAQDARVQEALVGSTYEALDRLVDLCIDRSVDALVVAGDTYDSRERSLYAEARFNASMLRLNEARIPVFMAAGNHDPSDSAALRLALPGNVCRFPSDKVGREEVVRDGETVAVVYGRSYGRRDETTNLSLDYRREPADSLAVGVIHANVGGNTDHEPYSPCTLEDLKSAGMDYWALGHIHKPGVLSEEPRVAYAGSPQGFNPKEIGEHGCWLVSLSSAGASAEFVPTASVVWAQGIVDLSGAEDLDDVRDRVRETCEGLRADARAPVVTRLDLTGRSEAHRLLANEAESADLLRLARDEQMSADPWLWIDRVRDRTLSPYDLDAVRSGNDFAADLVRIADELEADEFERDALLAEAMARLKSYTGGVDIGMSSAEVLQRARDLCLDRLLAEEEQA